MQDVMKAVSTQSDLTLVNVQVQAEIPAD